MSQSTLDDDDLLGEAASEIREDVEANLDAARSALPAADAIWDTDAENTLGVLNGLRSALDTDEATAHLRDAKKWFMVGERADAFENPDELEAELDELDTLIEEIEDARELVGDLTSTVPELRGSLEEFDTAGDGTGDADTDTDTDSGENENEAEAETEDGDETESEE